MKKCRIVERKSPDGSIAFVIQQKWLFGLKWRDAWLSWDGVACRDCFPTFEEAKKNLCYFDGSTCKEKVVFEKG